MRFNTQIHKLRQTNDIYFKQISLFQKICSDGNPPLISLHELNASSIVKKLAIVEKDSRTIWKALEDQFGFGYFRKIIEEDYGLLEDLEQLRKDMSIMITCDRLDQQ
jgi:hypothetical protein